MTNTNEKEKGKLKLFIWHGVRRDYTSGIAFAMAHNVEEARECIRKNSEDWEWDVYKGELMGKFEEWDKPHGDWISGGG